MRAKWAVIAAIAVLAVAAVAVSALALAQVSQRYWYPWPTLVVGVTKTGLAAGTPGIGPAVRGFRRGFFGIEVSDEFTSKVKGILESDPDVSKLLSEGYNVTAIRPVITLSVAGDGTVTMKATRAVATLRKDSSWAIVHVDVAQGKVISITIVTKTTIKK